MSIGFDGRRRRRREGVGDLRVVCPVDRPDVDVLTVPSIRNLVICVFRHRTQILVAQGFDDVKQESFLRPLGGAVQFGELVVDALRREIREELGEEIRDPVQLGVLENIFTYRGEPGHEIVFVFDATFVDADLYRRTRLSLNEPIWDGAYWIDLGDRVPFALYPEGLTTLLNVAV